MQLLTGRSQYAQGTGWRAYNGGFRAREDSESELTATWADYIGPRVMYDGYSARCIKDLLQSEPGASEPRTCL